MHGALTPLPLAVIGIPNAKVILVLAAPILTFYAMRWLARRTEEIIPRLFPHWEWEKNLGWLNITAERRANTFFRWLGYLVYATLAGALYGIVWSAEGFSQVDNWSDPYVASDLAVRMPVLLVSMGIWLFYLGGGLIPKLQKEYEEEELEKFRVEQAEIEKEREMNLGSRFNPSSHKPLLEKPVRSGRMGPGS